MSGQKFWWKDAKIYELYVDKFAGTFQGLTAKLDYFNRLGINTLHVLPHYPSPPMVDDGYDVSDYRDVRRDLGTLADFRIFVKEAHAHSIRVIIDFVLNHVSTKHPWFLEASASRQNDMRDFFLWSDTGNELKEEINCFPDMKPANWIRNDATRDFYYATFYPEQPDLNWDNPRVVEAMLAHMDFWGDMGVDGFRLDAAPFLIKREGTNCQGLPETHAVLKNIRAHLEGRYGGAVVLLAEANQTLEETKPYFGQGDECHMCYHFPLMKAMFLALARGDMTPVEKMIRASADIPAGCAWAVFLRNHDEITLSTLSLEEHEELIQFFDPDHRYVMKKGKTTAVRLGNIFSDTTQLEDAFQLLYAMSGVLINYYGDEIGMRNLPVRDGVIDTRIYVRGTFDWEEAERQMYNPNSLLCFVSELIHKAPHVVMSSLTPSKTP